MKKYIFGFILFCFGLTHLSAGNDGDDRAFSHLGVGVRASTLGLGVEASTPLSSYFKLRVGANVINLSKGFEIDVEDNQLEAIFGYKPIYNLDGKLNFFNGHVLVDIHPMKNGIFHFTAGAYIGQNKIKAHGYLTNQNGDRITLPENNLEWPILNFDGQEIKINKDGSINGALELGNVIKPYFGIGLGRSLPRSRFGFMFELGAMYQGTYKVTQNGIKVPSFPGSSSYEESFNNMRDITKYLEWYPMLNLQLIYRIF